MCTDWEMGPQEINHELNYHHAKGLSRAEAQRPSSIAGHQVQLRDNLFPSKKRLWLLYQLEGYELLKLALFWSY